MVQVAASRDQFFKTKICPRFTTGACRMGDGCYFAHDETELKKHPDLRKTKLCESWQRSGNCEKEKECLFAHGERQLRVTSKYWKTELCKYWKSGTCNAGSECRHAHGSHELRMKKKIQFRIANMHLGKTKAIEIFMDEWSGQRSESNEDQFFSHPYLLTIPNLRKLGSRGQTHATNIPHDYTVRNDNFFLNEHVSELTASQARQVSPWLLGDATVRHDTTLSFLEWKTKPKKTFQKSSKGLTGESGTMEEKNQASKLQSERANCEKQLKKKK